MQHIFIELWKFKDTWRDAGVDARAEYVEKLAPVVQAMTSAGVEIIAWGYNDATVDRRVDYDVFGVYRMPNRELFEKLQEGVAASGWYEYFEHVNAGGMAMSPPAILGDHIMLAPPRTFAEDISPAMTGDRRTTKVNGLDMSTVSLGEGRPIVFLHGDVGSAYLWRNVMPYAAQAGRAIGVDLIGSGESAKLPESHDRAYSFQTHYEYLSTLLDELGVTEDVVFVGQDWGCNLAYEWAKDHPGAVAGIAHCEPVTPPFSWDDWTPPMIRPMFQTMHSDEGEEFQLGGNGFVEAVVMGVLRTMSPVELDAYRKPYLRPGEDRRPPLDWAREVPLGGRYPETAARIEAHSSWVAESDIPKLLWRGEPGALVAGRRLELLRQWRNQEEVAVQGVHWPSEDDPHAMGRALLTWLEETVDRVEPVG